MIDTFSLLVALIAGAILGVLYFGGLQMTVRMLGQVRRPVPLFLASFLLRLTATLLIFLFLVRGGRWQMAIAALAGFTAARFLVVRYERRSPEQADGA